MRRKQRSFDVDGEPLDGEGRPERSLVPAPRDNVVSPVLTETEARAAQVREEYERLGPEGRGFVGASKAPETQRSYTYHWTAFALWCELRGLVSVPADASTIANYAAERAQHGVPVEERAEVERRAEKPARRFYAGGWKYSTLRQALAAIRLMHRFRGYPNPCDATVVDDVLAGIKRTKGARMEGKKPITPADLRKAFAKFEGLTGLRDRALLLVGFHGALRRGELAALEHGDIEWVKQGIQVDLRRHFSGKTVMPGTKTNVGGAEQELVPIWASEQEELCPVRSLREWLTAAGIVEGRIFRAVLRYKNKEGQWADVLGDPLMPQTVAAIVKRTLRLLDRNVKGFAGHSLRAGYATAADQAGVAQSIIQRQGRWKRSDTMSKYVRRELWKDNPSEGIE